MNKEKVINFLKWFYKSFIWLMVVIFVIDIASKWAVQNNLSVGQSVSIIPNFLNVTLSHNLGASFGMLSDGSIGLRIMWISISVILSGGLIFYFVKQFKKMSTWQRVSISLMIAGAIGNMIDRIFYWEGLVGFDGVIDWIDFQFGSYHFATFNIADSSLVIGVIIMIILLIVELIQDAIKKNKDGAYSLKPKDYEAKKAKESQETNKEIVEEDEDVQN